MHGTDAPGSSPAVSTPVHPYTRRRRTLLQQSAVIAGTYILFVYIYIFLHIIYAYLFCIYLFMVCFLYVTMDVGSFLRKLFGEPARGANIFLFGPNKLHTTTTRDGHAMMLSNTANRTNAAD